MKQLIRLPALALSFLLCFVVVPAAAQDMNGFRLPSFNDLESILEVLPDSVVAEIEQLPDSLRQRRILAEAGNLRTRRLEFMADSLLATLPDSLAAELSKLSGPERWHRVLGEAGKRLLLEAPRDSSRRRFVRASRGRLELEEPVAWDGVSPLHPDSVYSHAPEQEEEFIKAWLEANTPKFWTPEQQEKFGETFREDARRMNEVWRDSIQPIADSVKAEAKKRKKEQ